GSNERIPSGFRDFESIRTEILAHRRGVNDITRRKRAGARYDGFPDFDWPFSHGFSLDLRAASAFQRSGNPGSHPEMVVCGVDDGVNACLTDISLQSFNRGRAY